MSSRVSVRVSVRMSGRVSGRVSVGMSGRASVRDWREQFARASNGQTAPDFPFGFVQVSGV